MANSTKKTNANQWFQRIGILIGIIGLIIAFPQGYLAIRQLYTNKNSQPNNNNITNYKIISNPVLSSQTVKKSPITSSIKPALQNRPVSISENTSTLGKSETKSIITIDNVEQYLNSTTAKHDVAVLILDKENHIVDAISSGITRLYSDKGLTVTSSLFKSNFLYSTYLTEVRNANSQLIEKFNLLSHVTYLIIGIYSNEFDNGEYTKYISRAKLDITVISCVSKSQIDGFVLTAANGFDDKDHAEQGAIEKLLENFKLNHLNL